MEVHKDLKNKIMYFIKNKKIPHMVFHGPSGSGKRTVLAFLLENIYRDVVDYKNYIMYINCAHGKGIRFIRDELKFFAKMNIHNKNGELFKSIILFNADKLTMDAQSALRRCIEQFSHTTRFFIVIDQYQKLLKPIVSRFCNIYVPLPKIDNVKQSFHDFTKKKFIKDNKKQISKRLGWLLKKLEHGKNYSDATKLINIVELLYEKGYSALDVMHAIEISVKIPTTKKYGLLIHFDKIRREFRNEKLLISYILTLTFLRPDCNLENIQEM
tara:strand:+ start:92 stop:901 length:810 start_codon:yes stop_codon:yes gene_type:complete